MIMKYTSSSTVLFFLLFSCELPCLISFIASWQASRDIVQVDGYFAAFAAGTFLYLSLCHLVPEVFEDLDSSSGFPHLQSNINKLESNDLETMPSGELEFVEPNERQNDTDTGEMFTLSTLQMKSIAFLGLGSGFVTMSLLELNSGS